MVTFENSNVTLGIFFFLFLFFPRFLSLSSHTAVFFPPFFFHSSRAPLFFSPSFFFFFDSSRAPVLLFIHFFFLSPFFVSLVAGSCSLHQFLFPFFSSPLLLLFFFLFSLKRRERAERESRDLGREREGETEIRGCFLSPLQRCVLSAAMTAKEAKQNTNWLSLNPSAALFSIWSISSLFDLL
jgi:hypothetical protein